MTNGEPKSMLILWSINIANHNQKSGNNILSIFLILLIKIQTSLVHLLRDYN